MTSEPSKAATSGDAVSGNRAVTRIRPAVGDGGPPIFLVGCGRSGTTLMRLMLNAHPDVAIPMESHFMYQVARLRARGRWPGSLARDKDLGRLRAFLESQYYFSLWQMERPPLWDRFRDTDRGHASAFRAVFVEYAAQKGKLRWGDKTPRNVLYMLLLDRFFPDAKFLQVVRDGRDVALSLAGAPWGPRYISLAGHYWKWAVLSGKVAGAILGPSRYQEIRYEDLVAEPEGVLHSVCDWLDLEYTPAMLNYHQTKAADEYASQSEASQRVGRPPDRKRVRRWATEMSPRARRSLARQAGATLALLGYEVDSMPGSQERELGQLRALLEPTATAELARRVIPRTGPAPLVRWGLRADRAAQLTRFFGGDFAGWARADIRWQRTVASMLT